MSRELVSGVIEQDDILPKELRFISNFEDEARKKLHPTSFSFITCGADDQITLNNNVWAFKKYTIHPRYFVNTYGVDVSTTLFDGRKIQSPIGIAPTCCHAIVHKNAELETVKG
uniref:FMN-dependent dehydrogenase domain-containing protein n=1 Tax=Romanomermis culicivorax TaxID=13658 RepID=A0A915JHH5_ROMCU